MVQAVKPPPPPPPPGPPERYVLVDGVWVMRLKGAQDLTLVGKSAVNAI